MTVFNGFQFLLKVLEFLLSLLWSLDCKLKIYQYTGLSK